MTTASQGKLKNILKWIKIKYSTLKCIGYSYSSAQVKIYSTNAYEGRKSQINMLISQFKKQQK